MCTTITNDKVPRWYEEVRAIRKHMIHDWSLCSSDSSYEFLYIVHRKRLTSQRFTPAVPNKKVCLSVQERAHKGEVEIDKKKWEIPRANLGCAVHKASPKPVDAVWAGGYWLSSPHIAQGRSLTNRCAIPRCMECTAEQGCPSVPKHLLLPAIQFWGSWTWLHTDSTKALKKLTPASHVRPTKLDKSQARSGWYGHRLRPTRLALNSGQGERQQDGMHTHNSKDGGDQLSLRIH